MLASFVGNQTWFTFLLLIHVSGAIVGLGPSFAFSIIGPAIGKQESPQASMALMEVMEKIERGMVIPILLVVQLTSGILLIFNRSLNHNFFSSHRAWLVAGIGVYIVAMAISLGINTPALGKMIKMAKGGQAGTPEFGRLVKTSQTFG
ncbi:MAG TPA: hypothetical protein VGW79_01040, partial [Actinomycetota bacterium]|nr:hypothetical protein [Actinomycetota bacterium]